MRSPKSTGRIIGILLLLHLITGLTAPYIMLHPLNSPLSFNANDAGNAFQVRLSVMLLFVGGAAAMAIAFTAWPVFRQYSYTIALWVLALAVVNFSLQCGENAARTMRKPARQRLGFIIWWAQPCAQRGSGCTTRIC